MKFEAKLGRLIVDVATNLREIRELLLEGLGENQCQKCMDELRRRPMDEDAEHASLLLRLANETFETIIKSTSVDDSLN